MSSSSSDLMKLESLDREFILSLEQYQQLTNTYFSLNTEQSQLTSIQGSNVTGGTLMSFESLPSVNCCQSLCSSISNCAGANYDAQTEMCVITSGNVELYNTNNNSTYAIVSTKMQLLSQLQNLNQQLYNILNSSAILVKQVNPNSEAQTQQLRIESDKLRFKYDLFLQNKLELDNLIRENADLDNEYNTSSIMVKQSNLSYFFWSVGAIVIIIITIRVFYNKDS
jgi:hypothetical protein